MSITMGQSAIRQALQAGRYAEAERLAMAHIQEDRLAPQSWVFLGEALLHGGYLGAARAVFGRGALLDPQAQWIPEVEKAISSRPDGPERADIRQLLAPQTFGRTAAVTVAAAILTRNEARCIERCIVSLLGAVDEIIVVDSDSTDGTLEIASRYANVTVLRGVALEDDFAGKRNAALPFVRSDWVFWIDADEWLFPEDAAAVREAAAIFHCQREQVVLHISQVNHVRDRQSTEYGMPRMFPLRRGLRYYGRVHEQVIAEGRDMYDDAVLRRNVRIRVHHDGYEQERMESKGTVERNLRLLARMVEEEPGNPGWLLYYARESMAAGEIGAAKNALIQAEAAAEAKPGFGRRLQIYMLLYKIHMSERAFGEAEQACRRALALQPDFPDALFHLAEAQLEQAAELLRQAQRHADEAKSAFGSYRGTMSADEAILDWRSDLLLADLALMRGSQTEAKGRYEALFARHPKLAERRLKRKEKNRD